MIFVHARNGTLRTAENVIKLAQANGKAQAFQQEETGPAFASARKDMLGARYLCFESTIVSEGFKRGTRGAPIMPRDAVSRTANVGTVGMNGFKMMMQPPFTSLSAAWGIPVRLVASKFWEVETGFAVQV